MVYAKPIVVVFVVVVVANYALIYCSPHVRYIVIYTRGELTRQSCALYGYFRLIRAEIDLHSACSMYSD